MKISFIIPCFNEEKNVEKMKDSISSAYKNYDDVITELIFIDDGSSDNTLENLRKLKSDTKTEIKVIELSRHFGKESAMFAGLSLSSGDYICNIDADGQQEPIITVKMFDTLKKNKNLDCVTAVAKKRKEKFTQVFFKSLFYKTMNFISETEFVNGASDFRMYTRQVANCILGMKEYHRFTKGIFSFVGFNTIYIEYTPLERKTSKSKWSFKKLYYYALEGFTSFGSHLLNSLFIIGILLFIASIIMFIKFVSSNGIEGYFFDLPAIFLLNFIMLIESIKLPVLALLSEYLSKIYIQSKNRPVFIIKNSYNL
ncbi:MAG: glycosyltransferase family 2 protein [Clostridia bacterium]|nr:glycosyltransferase family 2 protein [Clostridia bacterium]